MIVGATLHGYGPTPAIDPTCPYCYKEWCLGVVAISSTAGWRARRQASCGSGKITEFLAWSERIAMCVADASTASSNSRLRAR